MKVTPDLLEELNELVEDAVSHICHEHQASGQCVWTCVMCYSTAKHHEFMVADK